MKHVRTRVMFRGINLDSSVKILITRASARTRESMASYVRVPLPRCWIDPVE